MSLKDRAVVPLLRRADAALRHIAVLHRAAIDDRLDLVIALGSPENGTSFPGGVVWWGEREKLALFLQDRQDPDRVFILAIESGQDDCFARIERATATGTVISCTGEKSTQYPHRKFVYDARGKVLLHRYQYTPFKVYRIYKRAGTAVFVASDAQRLVAIEYNPNRNPAFRVLNDAEGRPWTALYIQPDEFKPVRLGPSLRFLLTETARGSPDSHLVILEGTGSNRMRHALPQSTYDAFAAARPGRVKDGYVREGTQIREEIGPWQLEDGRLWFGKTFYDGEGTTGVGRFGYFDASERRYHIFAPAEVQNWSVTALRADPDAVWLALAHHGEWGSTSGGLLRFDRTSETIRHIDLPDVAGAIVRLGDQILIASNFGFAIVAGDRLQRYFIDRTTSGRLRVVAAAANSLNFSDSSGRISRRDPW